MTRPLLSFVAIVKDEAKTIRATLESVKPFVDLWCVVDTGSTDGTQHIIKESCGWYGHLYEKPFVDYSTTRNEALFFAEHMKKDDDVAAFTLMLSADEVLEGGEALRTFLEAHRDAPDGAYCVTMFNGSQQWPYPRVLRTDAGWRYEGVIQERPIAPDGITVDAPLIPGVRVVFKESDPARKVKRLRERDLPLLTRVVEDESKPYDDRARAMYYLAETHAVLAAETPRGADGKPDFRSAWLTHSMAAMSYYWRYALIAEDPAHSAEDRELAMRGYFLYYHIADKISLFEPTELAKRLGLFCELAPTMPELHLLRAEVAARIDVRQGLFFALKAAEVAKHAFENPPKHATVDVRCEWLSFKIAAVCAKALGQGTQAQDLARRGMMAGGPPAAFEGLL